MRISTMRPKMRRFFYRSHHYHTSKLWNPNNHYFLIEISQHSRFLPSPFSFRGDNETPTLYYNTTRTFFHSHESERAESRCSRVVLFPLDRYPWNSYTSPVWHFPWADLGHLGGDSYRSEAFSSINSFPSCSTALTCPTICSPVSLLLPCGKGSEVNASRYSPWTETGANEAEEGGRWRVIGK